jgi:hypothetical protein
MGIVRKKNFKVFLFYAESYASKVESAIENASIAVSGYLASSEKRSGPHRPNCRQIYASSKKNIMNRNSLKFHKNTLQRLTILFVNKLKVFD